MRGSIRDVDGVNSRRMKSASYSPSFQRAKPDVDGPEGIEVRDFHALRNCYISDVIRTGADLKQSMTLARHSDPRLTAGRYARTRLFDLGAVVNKLPTATLSDREPAALRMTGDRFCAATGAAKGGCGRVRLRMVEEFDGEDEPEPGSNKPLDFQGFEGERKRLGTIETERGGFNFRLSVWC